LADKRVKRALEIINSREDFQSVEFIILYGSQVRSDAREDSDIDLAVYYEGTDEEAFKFRREVLGELYEDYYDIQIFQQLPLYIQIEVLEGEILYCKDIQMIYETANLIIKQFSDFKRYYYDYIGEMEIT
jgi:predicted nucleotidyltransferase